MFTGIIEEVGTVHRLSHSGAGYELALACRAVIEGACPGDSIAVNGVCLTVTKLQAEGFTVGLSPETRRRTNLIHLQSGSPVNLERSITPATRLGGHFVQGHIDGLGIITAFRRDDDALRVTIRAYPELMHYIVPKGYIALDGASLTVVDVDNDWFTVQMVAYTQQCITLPHKRPGESINIEVDVLGKYVDKMMDFRQGQSSNITFEFLAENGYE
ncbi:MAG: riboflavin synthase [Anaerolineae bacterium]|nr:riboflavin synthase [Anaerolineae bacterium]